MLNFENSVAVVVGINAYEQGISKLSTAVNDANSIADILENQHQYEVHKLIDQEASQGSICGLLARFQEQLTEKDRLLFYFAGHGIALDGDDGPTGYLIPQDAHPSEPSTYLAMQHLHDELALLNCRHCLVILDCCFGGAVRWSSTRDIASPPQVIYQQRFDRYIADPAWQVITSAGYDQKAADVLSLEDDRGENQLNSPFAKALIDALKGKADAFPPAQNGQPAGDGVITATELYQFVRDRVELATQPHQRRQTPSLWPLYKHDKGEYIFLTPGHSLNLPPAPILRKENNPYRGLESFEEEHSELYFGREKWIHMLAQEVFSSLALTIVLGASGTGKSSLVKAGLIPYLRKLDDRQFRILAPMRPGETPLRTLAQICLPLINEVVDDRFNINSLHERFLSKSEAFADLIKTWGKTHQNSKVLLVVDQFEELVTVCHSASEKDQFQRLIHKAIAANSNLLHVVITLRLDFEAQFQTAALQTYWMKSRFVIPPMTQDELREVIEKPALARVLYFEPSELIDKLINEVIQMPGALPLLSFSLSELYLRYLGRPTDNRSLTEDDYKSLGGVVGSLTQRATQEYDSFIQLDPAYAELIRKVMLRMVAVEGGETARRRVPKSELLYSSSTENVRVEEIIRRFLDARLIVQGRMNRAEVSEEIGTDSYVEPAHDALVRGWDKLLQWKKVEQENLLIQRRLTQVTKAWEDSGRRDRDLWNNNSRLDQLKEICNSNNNWLNKLETEFVKRSLSRRRNLVLRLIVVGLTVIAALSGVTLYALNESSAARRQEAIAKVNEALAKENKDEAERQAQIAIKQAKKAQENEQKANTQTEFAQKQTKLAKTNELRATQQRIIAQQNEIKANEEKKRANKQTQIAKRSEKRANEEKKRANRQTQIAKRNEKRANHQANIAIARQLATQAEILKEQQDTKLQTSMLLALESMKRMPLALAEKSIRSGIRLIPKKVTQITDIGSLKFISMSPRRNILAIVTSDNYIFLRTKLNKKIAKVYYENNIEFSTFSNDDRYIASAVGKDIFVRNINTEQEIELKHDSHIKEIIFSPQDKYIAAVGEEKTCIWEFRSHHKLACMDTKMIINSVAFSQNEKYLAGGTHTGAGLYIWEVATGKELHHENIDVMRHSQVYDLAFSPNDEYLVTGSYFGAPSDFSSTQVWDFKNRKKIASFKHQYAAFSVDFNPGGKHLVTTHTDGSVKLWDINTRQEIKSGFQHDGPVTHAKYGPDGKFLLTESKDNTIRIWDVETTQEILRIPDVEKVAFDQNWKYIATISNKTVQIWEIPDRTFTSTLKHDASIHSIAFSPINKILATTSGWFQRYNNKISMWDLTSGKRSWENLTKNIHTLEDISFSLDGKTVSAKGQYLWLLNVANGSRINNLVSPNGKYSAIYKEGGFSVVETLSNSNISFIPEHIGALGKDNIAFSPDGKYFATIGDNSLKNDAMNSICIWNVIQGKKVFCMDFEKSNISTRMFISPAGKYIGIKGMKNLYFMDFSPNPKTTIKKHSYFLPFSFSSDDNYFVTIKGLNSINETKKGDNSKLLNNIMIWNTTSGQAVAKYEHKGTIKSVKLSSSGRYLAIGSSDGTAKIWKLGTKQELIVRHEGPVNSVDFSPDEKYIATGSEDSTSRIWDLKHRRELARWKTNEAVSIVKFSPDGKLLAVASDKTALILDWWIEDPIFELCSRLTRNLKRSEWNQYIDAEPYSKTCPNLPIPDNDN